MNEQIAGILDEIATSLSTPPPPTHHGLVAAATSLMGREPGFALFYAYLDRFRPNPKWQRKANRFLTRAITALADQGNPYFAGGFTGAAWALEHLDGWFIEIAEDTNDEIDGALLALVEQDHLNYDLQNGVAGFGLYATERLPNPNARLLLERVVHWLDRRSVSHRGGIAWATRPEGFVGPGADQLGSGGLFPGVFAGVAGVAGLMGAAIHHQISEATARRLLEGAFEWLWTTRVEGLFPAPNQLAWDAGSLGIASVMFVASRAAGWSKWQERSLKIARQLARADGHVLRDPAIGFGAAGAAHMFHRLHLHTGEQVFADASELWIRRLSRRRRRGAGLAGFRSYSAMWNRRYLNDPKYPVGWIGLPGFINGVAGIGLVLLAVQGQDPIWDRMLLLSYA